MSKELPARPSLEHLKSQAKELLDALTRGEQSALERVRTFLPAARSAAPAKQFALHDAQSALAREYGFESWAALRREVVRRRPLSPELLRALMRMPLPPAVEASLFAAATVSSERVPQLPELLPLVAVRNAVILVGSIVPLCIGRARSLAAVDAALAHASGLLAVFAQRRDDIEEPGRGDLFEVGCVAQIVAVHRETQPGVWLVLRALQSVRLEGLASEAAYSAARIAPFEIGEEDAASVPELTRELLERARTLARALPDAERVLRLLEELAPPELADLVVANLPSTVEEKARYASEVSLPRRLVQALALVDATAPA
jgi:Lon protease-like protein